MRLSFFRFLPAVAGTLLCAATTAAESSLVLKANMEVLKCPMPDAANHLAGSNGPGQLFHSDEAVHLKLSLKKGDDKDFALEIQEITTRDPGKKADGGFTDTAGQAPLIGLEGKPVTHPFAVQFTDKPETVIEVKDVPVPKRYGTYAVVLLRGGKRHFISTVARLPVPSREGRFETAPIVGEGQLFNRPENYAEQAAMYARMGVRGMRAELGWNEGKDGKVNWERTDALFDACEKAGVQVMVTVGGHPSWTWPFGPDKQTPAAVGPNWDGNPYWAQADWLCEPKYYPRLGEWTTTFCRRYWKDGKGALWGLENFNEPWEGGGISGWARDCLQYRAIHKTLAEGAWKVDRRIKMCAASSIMNTEDKLYSDGSKDFDKYIDVFTDHYVVPCMCYGPMVAAAHGKESMETETWFVNSEYLLPHCAQFLASGQKRLSPWHPRVLFDQVPGNPTEYAIPTPVVAATAAFNRFVTAKPFEKLAFHDHLPWVFQFGKDDDKAGVLIVFGKLMNLSGDDPKDRLWSQVESAEGGTLTIDNADGLLKFFDLAGNPAHEGQKSVTLPLSIIPLYVQCDKGPAAAAARLKQAKIDGKRPVEILPHDFTTRVDAKGAVLNVTLHNCLNRAIAGKLAVKAPADLSLATAEQSVKLEAGERKTLAFPLTGAKPNAANAYPCMFQFASDAGNAEYAEVMNAAIVPKKTFAIDGNLDKWKDVPGVTVAAGFQAKELTELMRRPWLELKDQHPDGNLMEFKLAWDEKFLYVAARVNDKTPQLDLPAMAGRDENEFFHSKASDERAPFKEFLKKFPGRSFAEVPYVYCKSPEGYIPFRRDRLHIGLDVTAGWHDLKPTTDKVPQGFHAVPDTDYEYALYPVKEGKSELWRLLAPGVPRIHDFPRQLHGARTTGPVPNAKFAVKREGNTYLYELAIPHEELAELSLKPGTTFGLMVRAGNDKGPQVDYGVNKAVTKSNGLSLHPYWERKSNCGVRWTLTE